MEAWVWLGVVQLSLYLVPFRWIYRFVESKSLVEFEKNDSRDVERAQRVSLAIRRAARLLPWAPLCLARALAGKLMLGLRGVRADLTFGVKTGAFEAHAWLRCSGFFVTGETQHEKFKALSRKD